MGCTIVSEDLAGRLIQTVVVYFGDNQPGLTLPGGLHDYWLLHHATEQSRLRVLRSRANVSCRKTFNQKRRRALK